MGLQTLILAIGLWCRTGSGIHGHGLMLSESSLWVFLCGILCNLKAIVPYSYGAIKDYGLCFGSAGAIGSSS